VKNIERALQVLSINFIGNSKNIWQKSGCALTLLPLSRSRNLMEIDLLFDQSARRRWWLLIKALECIPLDKALNLARDADEFVLGDAGSEKAQLPIPMASALPLESTSESHQADCNAGKPAQKKISQPLLSPARRDELLDRIARGATNAVLAAEFGLTPRQVQGMRMGAARMAGRARPDDATLPQDQDTPTPASVDPASVDPASVDDVVRYLRQQDDVVVPEGNGTFLVNGRFHLGLSELVAKANRARNRQKKQPFKVNGILPAASASLNGSGQTVFWPPSIGVERERADGH
jgi:hypothetical protein